MKCKHNSDNQIQLIFQEEKKSGLLTYAFVSLTSYWMLLFYSCGEEIAQSHSFWSLSILQQNLPWINVLFPCLRLGFLFWAKVTILDFLPNFRCMLLTFRLLSPKGLLTDLWECRSSTDCTGEAGSWLWAGEHLKFSAGSWCSPRKKCSELWKVK